MSWWRVPPLWPRPLLVQRCSILDIAYKTWLKTLSKYTIFSATAVWKWWKQKVYLLNNCKSMQGSLETSFLFTLGSLISMSTCLLFQKQIFPPTRFLLETTRLMVFEKSLNVTLLSHWKNSKIQFKSVLFFNLPIS